MQDENKPFDPFANQPQPEPIPQTPATPYVPPVVPVQPAQSQYAAPSQQEGSVGPQQTPSIETPQVQTPPAQPSFESPVSSQPQSAQPEPMVSEPMPQVPVAGPVKSNKKLIIYIVVGVLVALGLTAGALAYFGVFSKKSSSVYDVKDTGSALSTSPSEKKSVEVSSVFSASQVCNGSKISNAKAYDTTPHRVMSFVSHSGTWATVVSEREDTDKYNAPEEVKDLDIVMCMSVDESNIGAAISCDVTDATSSKTAKVSFNKVTYKYEAYKAQTGELIKQGTIASNTTCPLYGSTDSSPNYLSPSLPELYVALDMLIA